MGTGKFKGPAGKQRMTELWNDLAKKLNALGCGVKTASKWQKSFADWKYNVKQKYAEIQTQRSKTGGGPAFQKTLTGQEERLLGLIARSSMDGDGAVEEIGLGQVATATVNVEPGPSTSYQSLSPEPPQIMMSPEPEEIIIVQSPSVSRPSSRTTNISDSSRITPRISRTLSEGETLERFQAETMGNLQEINENLSSMSQNLSWLTDAIVHYLSTH